MIRWSEIPGGDFLFQCRPGTGFRTADACRRVSQVELCVLEPYRKAIQSGGVKKTTIKIVILDGYTENPGDLSWEAFA